MFQSQDLPSIPLIAPFWVDINIEGGGQIFYRQTDVLMSLQHAVDLIEVARVSLDVKRNFSPTSVFIATWDRVAGFSADSDSDVSADCNNNIFLPIILQYILLCHQTLIHKCAILMSVGFLIILIYRI